MNHKPEPLQHIVVVGQGLVAAGAAVTLAKMLRPFATRISWVQVSTETNKAGIAGAEVADPALGRWLEMIGLPEAKLLHQCQGLYSLGAEYRLESKQFFVPHASHGIQPSPAPFEQEFFKRFSGPEQLAFSEHFLATRAAAKARFAFPAKDPRSARSTLKYGLHLERAALVEAITAHAQNLGVVCQSTDSLQVHGDPQRGIQALSLDGGIRLEADFFIDATGESSRLLGQALGVEFQAQSRSLWPYRITFSEPAESPLKPRSEFARIAGGWRRRAGLRDKTIVDAWLCDQAALDRLEASLREQGCEFASWQQTEGARAQGWVYNCLALGGADAQPGELVLSQWYWACRCLLLWLELLPSGGDQTHLRAEYNRRRSLLYQRLNEVHWMHAAGVECAHADLPADLKWRLDVFTRLGRLWRRDEEVLADEAWLSLALGLGWHAGAYDLTLANIDPKQLAQKHRAIYQTLEREADTMPFLEAVLKDPTTTRFKQNNDG
ncbi:tryptophan 7-halogenase [Gilvimarinus xylanilyticus]|uniref:Tryptophan 7-halogenase n=1 Tax=Gilvimarinus xylanilyticus TaxID=2944139 RepID=A0A9X2HYY1_9GAMM|nr:tryptophan 7-halogenase [Gilvimarinus xylanilyticus]